MWLLIYSGNLDSGIKTGETVNWKEIREMHKSNWWKIGWTKLEVMQRIPEEQQGVNISIDDIKAKVLKMWKDDQSEDAETFMVDDYGRHLW